MEKIDSKKKRKNRNFFWLYLFGFLFLVCILVIIQGISSEIYEWTAIGITGVPAFVFLICYIFPGIPNYISVIIGENHPSNRNVISYWVALFLLFPFLIHFLRSEFQNTLFANNYIVIIAPTLGGLIFAGATNRRIPRKGRVALLDVVKKFIVATVMFIIFTPLLSSLDTLGGINVNDLDISLEGILRGFSFWGANVLLYSGLYLFLLGIINLVLALKHLKT